MSFEFDTSEFEARLAGLEHKAQEAFEKGVALAGMRVLRDAVMKVPTVPIDTGTLRGSMSVLVQNKLHHVNPTPKGHRKAAPKPATVGDAVLVPDEWVAQIGANTPYAAYLHEGTHLNFSNTGSGAKYLERALLDDPGLLLRIASKPFKDLLSGKSSGPEAPGGDTP